MRLPIAALFCLLFSVTASGDPNAPSDNPYASNYVSRMPVPAAQGEAVPRILRGTDKDMDYQRLLEDGYDLLGYSSFEATDVGPELLAAQVGTLHADLALVYTQRMGRVPASVRVDQAKAAVLGQEGATIAGKQPVFYQYYATYWSKLPPPLLGLHVRREDGMAEHARGLQVIAVIRESPAAAAGILRGDTLLRIGDTDLLEPQALLQAARRYAGQAVEVELERDGETIRQTVQLRRAGRGS